MQSMREWKKNIKSECAFIGHKNNNSYFKCKKCGKIWLKPSLLSTANLNS